MGINYRCICDQGFSNRKSFIAHYRKEHPEDGWSLWDQIGDLGDAFANSAMTARQERLKEGRTYNERRIAELEEKAKAYDSLVPRFNAIARALQISKLAVDGAMSAAAGEKDGSAHT